MIQSLGSSLDFAAGDTLLLRRTFTAADFAAFRQLSGDANALHHDAAYAAGTRFGRPILPMHLSAAPFSAVAGMVFPGRRALILGNAIKAIKPIFYDQEVTYSAQIVALHEANRVLRIRALGLTDAGVCLESDLRVQVREDGDAAPEPLPDNAERFNVHASRTALITGATGAIGRATARALARAGWRLLLHTASRAGQARQLAAECQGLGVRAEVIEADLRDTAQVRRLCDAAQGNADLGALIHTASAPVDAGFADLAATNITALDFLQQALLPQMLRRQYGRIVLLGSTAVHTHPAGWSSYVAAKSAATSLVQGLHKDHSTYNVYGLTLAPHYVDTPFSAAYRPAGSTAMIPEEVAAALLGLIETTDAGESYWMLQDGSISRGRFGFHSREQGSHGTGVTHPPLGSSPISAAAGNGRQPRGAAVGALVCRMLALPVDTSAADVALDVTPGWDSLKHIEIMLEIERALGLRFTAPEIEKTKRLPDLIALVDEKSR